MKQRTTFLLFIAPLLFAGALLLVFERTDPVSVGPGGVLAVFVLLYLFFLSSLFIALHFGVPFVSRLVAKRRRSLQMREVTVGKRKAYYIASLIAFVPVLLLAMGSFAEIRFTDIALILAFTSVMTFYIVKRQ